MYSKVRPLILAVTAGVALTGCASYYYSQVPMPFTSNYETQQIDNNNFQVKLQKMVDKKFPKSDVKIVTDHYNVLIVGEVESAGTKVGIPDLIKQQRDTKKVFDYTTVTPKPSLHYNSSLVSDVQGRLKEEPDIDVAKFTVVAVSGVVYLMGTNVGNLSHLARAIKGIYALPDVTQVIDLVQKGPGDYYLGQ